MRRYRLVCTALGLALGWLPMLVHGPIPWKYDRLGMRGAIAVGGRYTARLLIGFVVGISTWSPRWYLRGPLCGLVMLFPLSIVSLSTPGCEGACMFWNDATAVLIGAAVITGREHA